MSPTPVNWRLHYDTSEIVKKDQAASAEWRSLITISSSFESQATTREKQVARRTRDGGEGPAGLPMVAWRIKQHSEKPSPDPAGASIIQKLWITGQLAEVGETSQSAWMLNKHHSEPASEPERSTLPRAAGVSWTRQATFYKCLKPTDAAATSSTDAQHPSLKKKKHVWTAAQRILKRAENILECI